VNEAEEVLGFSIPPRVDPSELLQPSEETLDLPALAIATKSTAVLLALRTFPSSRRAVANWRHELDVAHGQLVGKLGAVETSVGDQLFREFFDEGGVEGLLDEGDVVAGAICDANGERKTSAVCKRHDLRRIAGTASSDAAPPFLAPA